MNCCIMSELERYIRRSDEIISQMTNKMLCRSSLSDVTVDFCDCMIPHHQAAIYMCENLLQYTQNEELIELCNKTIQTQSEEIGILEDIRDNTSGFVNTLNDVNIYVSQYINIVRNMACRMRNNPRNCRCVNLTFINEMIPHNEGAICLCENALQCCIDPRLKTLCEEMIQEATEQIAELRQIRCAICNS